MVVQEQTKQQRQSRPEMFGAYTFERRRGRSQAEALDEVERLTNAGSEAQWRAWREALVADEETFGIGEDPENTFGHGIKVSLDETIERVNRRGEPEPEPVLDDDIAAIEADARQRVQELEAQRQRMAPEALVDGAVAAELAQVEDELREARRRARDSAAFSGPTRPRRRRWEQRWAARPP